VKNILLILLIVLISASGFIYSIYVKRKYDKIISNMVADGYSKVENINTVIDSIQTGNNVTLEDLEKTKKKLDAILKDAADKKQKELSIEDALKVIKGVK
jgi:cell shape-determining protein MreC